jgi:hypothetical protein
VSDTASSMHKILAASGIEYAAMSWGGHNLFGDAKSIEEARRLLHEAGKVDPLQNELCKARGMGCPRVRGVSRVADNERALLLSMDSRPTDDDLRALYDWLRQ